METKLIRLAHYSIKEYLTSGRICKDLASTFSFTDSSAHLWIARSSLAYVLNTGVICEMPEYFDTYFRVGYGHRDTLQWYTAENWPHHLEMVPGKFWPTEVVNMAKFALSIRSQGLITTLSPHSLRNANENWLHPYYFTALSGYSQLTELLLSDKYLTQEDMDTMLLAAARAGSKELVLTLLDRGAAVNAETVNIEYQEDGDALQVAVQQRDLDMVRIFLERGVDVNAQRGIWGSALQAAAQQDGLEMLELLIDHGADINGPSNAAGCVLSSAASRGDNTRYLEFLLAKGADINMLGTEEYEKTALHVAARWENWNNFDLLLQRGADINLGGRYGFPLHGLARRGKDIAGALVRMRRLVEMGADPKAQCEELGTALHVACASPYPDSIQIAQFLVDNGVNVNVAAGSFGAPLQASALSGNIKLTEWLLANKADVNLQGGKYGNALQGACRDGNLKIVQLLLAHGADVNAQGGYYGNALQAVCSKHCDWDSTAGYIHIVRLLLEGGADVNAAGGHFGTALQAATHSDDDDIEIVHLLLEHGADTRIQGGYYGNALNAAAAAGTRNLDLLQLLLDHGADVNQVSGEFGTVLHNALEMQRTEWASWSVSFKDVCISKIQFLLENGADINLSGGKYGLLLQSACVIGSFSSTGISDHVRRMDAIAGTIKLFLDYEPRTDVNAHSGVFGTALQAAAYSGLAESIRLLLDRGARVACHEWCGKYGSALNAAVIKGHWDIVHLLREAGARPDCYSMQKPDEQWLLKVRQDDGRGAEERYRKFWESEKPLQEQTLLPRSSLLKVFYFSWLLVPFRLFIAFMMAKFIRPKKREQS